MKMKIWLVFFLLSCTILTFGQNKIGKDRESDHEALRSLTKVATDALNNQDFDTLAKCFVENFTFITVDQSVISNKAEMKAYYQDVLNNEEYGVTGMKFTPKADVLTTFLGDNVGYCYGTADNEYTMKSGKTIHMESRWSANLIKKDGEWKVVMIHSGVNFLDNPLLNSVISSAKIPMTIMAVIVFLLIGVIIYLLLRKKSTMVEKNTAETSA